ncbi:MAG TPA: PPC domain-containing protein [Chroococcidiopsis sp.]
MKIQAWVGGMVAGVVLAGLPVGAALAQSTLLQENGVLEEGDQVLSSDNSLYDEYSFDGQEGQTVTITLSSDDFDPYLVLISPEGEVLAQNDDVSPDNFSSEISLTLPADGTYTVIANGYDSSSQGNYVLEVVGE